MKIKNERIINKISITNYRLLIKNLSSYMVTNIYKTAKVAFLAPDLTQNINQNITAEIDLYF